MHFPMLWSCHVTVNDEQRPVDIAAVDGIDHFLREAAVSLEENIEVELKTFIAADELDQKFEQAAFAEIVKVFNPSLHNLRFDGFREIDVARLVRRVNET